MAVRHRDRRALPRRRIDPEPSLHHRSGAPQVDEFHIVTLAPEAAAYWSRGISYVYGDLRDLPYRDGYFDTVVCISAVEHVGMDNSVYGDSSPRASAPLEEQGRALRDLLR